MHAKSANATRVSVRLQREIAERLQAPLLLPADLRREISEAGFSITQAGVTRWLLDPAKLERLMKGPPE